MCGRRSVCVTWTRCVERSRWPRGQLPARPPGRRPLERRGLHRLEQNGSRVPFVTRSPAFSPHSDCALGPQLAPGRLCRNSVCAPCVPGRRGGAERALRGCRGLVPAGEGLPSLCCGVCQECAALDGVVANRKSIHGILMKGSSSFLQE